MVLGDGKVRRIVLLTLGWEELPKSVSVYGAPPELRMREPVPGVLLQTDGGWVLLDTGFNTALIRDPALYRRFFPTVEYIPVLPGPGEPIEESLHDIGIDVDDIHLVALSHLHHDHAELGSLGLVHGVPVLTGAANARWLRAHGVEGVAIGDRSWWRVPGTLVEVRLVPAVHGHRPMPHRPNAAHGFLVRGGGRVVWFAGDTAPFPAMAHLPELAGGPIDLALVPVGGWGPRLSGGHMDPVQAAHACAVAGARAAVPVHWGTLHAPASRRLPPGWMDRAGAAFEVALERFAPGCRAVVLEPGEAVDVVGRAAAG